MKNLQNNCLDALMLNFNNYFLPIKQGSTMDLCYLHKLQWETSKIFIFPRIRVSISNDPELSAHIFPLKSMTILLMLLPKELSQNLRTTHPLIFRTLSVWSDKPVEKKNFSLANEVLADDNCNIKLRVRGGQKVKQTHEVYRNL